MQVTTEEVVGEPEAAGAVEAGVLENGGLARAPGLTDADLWRALQFPGQRGTRVLVLGAALAMGVADWVGPHARVLSLGVFLCVWLGLAVGLVKVLREAAQGVERPLRWRGVEDAWHQVFDPLLRLAAGVVLCFLPLLLLYSAGSSTRSAALAVAAFALPVALATVSLEGALLSFHWRQGLERVRQRPRSYATVSSLGFVVLLAAVLATFLLEGFPYLDAALVPLVWIYAATALARAQGLFLRMTR